MRTLAPEAVNGGMDKYGHLWNSTIVVGKWWNFCTGTLSIECTTYECSTYECTTYACNKYMFLAHKSLYDKNP